MDSDLSHNPKFIPPFIIRQELSGCDIVTGTRYSQGGGITGWGFKRKLMSQVANFLALELLKPGLTDLTGSYRLYKKEALDKVISNVRSKGYVFQMEIIVRSQLMDYSVNEVPILFVDRLYGKSKLGPKEVFDYLKGLV
eukprot:CAMPEP_0171460030 /NCGR_PEP_ID=MMETSP0945-20130129/5063_1 /TAXON_ID=109269 /ORGANISM="Vaucheria litorea, Strain CCMP2940" /LENGTH=138 /DNA_ID=CAMNT_0011986139 /DNA_START=359 /DNA_END=772 /DNA_ORIENTATION=-